jgi:hypothetical protein
LGASFSVGGFSNGLAFGSLLVCLLVYQQAGDGLTPQTGGNTKLHEADQHA